LSKRIGDKRNYCCRYLPIIIIASLLFLSYTLISTIPHAYAHAYVIGSDPYPSQSLPKAPSDVVVHLSEPVDIRYSSVKVLGPGGNQIDKKDDHFVNGDHTTLAVTLPAGVKDGVYTVSTKMLSETDGHVTENAFVFGVGHAIIPNSVPNASTGLSSLLYIPEAIARFPTLVGQVIIVGGAFATLWLWRPIARIDWLANSIDQVRTRIDKRIAILMVIGAAILLASDFGMIYAEAKSIDISILDAIGTKFGSLWVYRLVTSIVLMCLSVLLFLNQRKNKGGRTQKPIIYGLLGVGLIALLTTSLIGHGAALNPPSVPILIDFVHNLAASLWIGGVIYLAFVVVPGIKQSCKDEYIKASLLSLLIPRFSTIPVVILGTIVITGPFLLYLLEPDLGLTLASLYGKALIAKLILAGVMIGIGAYNQSIIHRDSLKMVAVASNASGSDASQKKGSESTIDVRNSSIDNLISKFGKTTKAEAFVGIALLAAVAVLVNTGLPASEFQNLIQQVQQQQQQSIPGLNFANGIATPQQGFTATNYIGNNQKVTLSINPYIPGNNKFQIEYSDSNGNPVDIKSVQLRYTQTDKGIGPITVDTDKVSEGIFSVNAAFGLAGPWDLQVEATPAANAPDIVTEYNLFVKPKLSDFSFNVKEYKMPSNNAQPLFPLYDKSRNVVWTGDSSINSGRIWEFSLTNHTHTEHKIPGANIITLMAFDPTNNDIWFIDPLNKNLGHYNPETGATQLFKIPVESVLSGIAIDPSSTNIWVSLATANEVLGFNILEKTFSTPIKLPSQNATPLGIIADQSGQIWVAESGTGKLANIDPTKNNKVTEFVPTGGINNTLKSPTALLADPNSDQIYISEHDGHTVSVFNPILRTFSKYPPLNPSGLPFGMALDNYRNLWVAEHVINKIAVIDPSTGEHSEVNIPQQSPFVQWITSDSQGNIWMAEQRAASLGQITIIAKPSLSSLVGSQSGNSPAANSNNGNKISLPTFSFSYAEIVGPSVAAGIVVSALFYAKTIIDLKRSEQLIRKTAKVTRS
jgi:copper transport protein